MATLVTVPERSVDQRMEALQLANDIRSRRAEIKCDLKAGRVSIRDLIAEPPSVMASAKVFDFLIATPGRARVKTAKVFKTCRVSPSKTFDGLSDRQRAALLALLDGARDPIRSALTRRRPPSRQRAKALSRANRIRLARADTHRRVVDGEITVPDLLRKPPTCVVSLAIGEFVCWQPRWGDKRMRSLLVPQMIDELRPVGAR